VLLYLLLHYPLDVCLLLLLLHGAAADGEQTVSGGGSAVPATALGEAECSTVQTISRTCAQGGALANPVVRVSGGVVCCGGDDGCVGGGGSGGSRRDARE
jgi:hypothetical protein